MLGLLVHPGQPPPASHALPHLKPPQLIPQIVINYRRHHATGLQPSMMMLWAWAGVPLGAYNIVSELSIALRIQPQILTLLSLVTWIQCYYYERVSQSSSHRTKLIPLQKWTVARSLATVVPIVAVMAGVQAALIVGLRILKERHVEWPMILTAVLSAALLAAGVLRHYWDIWVHRAVRGISFLFVGIDAAGDVFSLMSILFQPTLDVLAIVIYATELVLWCGVFACGGYYNFLPWVQKKWLAQGSRDGQSTGDEPTSDPIAHGNTVTLHDIPSSTSVFRTVSRESAELRARAIASSRRAVMSTS